ncbi:MAG: FtsH protease activity modulator HflK [Pseudomonadota bacterium]|nr:FtsH protease activity modulator HflK [Pseudomonadota bacterium]
MPWNEPGGRDPWGRRPKDQGPPDLEELLRKLTASLSKFFGGARGGGGRGATAGVVIVGAVLLVAWLFSGFYIIDAGERGLVLRFGRFIHMTGPGPHWHLPYPFESVERVAVDLVRNAEHRETMLTEDENIVVIDTSVQYRVKNAANYAFKVLMPDTTVGQVMESAVREVVGAHTMEFALGVGRAQIALDTHKLMQKTLDKYQSGIQVITVNLQQAQPPEPVQPAFADVVKAREDEVRFRNEARSYANGVIPRARGAATRIRQEAAAYRDRVVAAAEGDTARFKQLLAKYRNAPRVTRDRLYLETIESVLTNSSKVMMDAEEGRNLLYLPLDKLLPRGGGGAGGKAAPIPPAPVMGDLSNRRSALRPPRSFSREAR